MNSHGLTMEEDLELSMIPLLFTLPEFTPSREISWEISVYETEQQSHYDMVIGRDLQLSLKLEILFATKQFRWDGLSIPMRIQNSGLPYLETRIKNIDNPRDGLLRY
jgi:hypothetical protein